MPGVFYKNTGKIDDYIKVTSLFSHKIRHSSLLVRNDTLYVFYSQVGDTPERIYLSTIHLSDNIKNWKESDPIELIRPTLDWEGVDLPLQHSSRSAISIPVNQLRDPAVFRDSADIYLLYTVQGERGIGISHIELS
jgi:hypothetical protein